MSSSWIIFSHKVKAAQTLKIRDHGSCSCRPTVQTQPNREGLLKDQGLSAKGRSENLQQLGMPSAMSVIYLPTKVIQLLKGRWI